MYQNILINRVTELRLRVQKKYCDEKISENWENFQTSVTKNIEILNK